MPKKPSRSSKSLSTTATKAQASKPLGRRRLKTKKQIALSRLRRPKGASIAELQDALGWQAHSVRGFLAGSVKKKLGLTLFSEKNASGERVYWIAQAAGTED